MKSIVMPETVQLTEETKDQLTHEVKETVAENAISDENQTFTVSQLWNCHRQMRTASSMLSRWNLN